MRTDRGKLGDVGEKHVRQILEADGYVWIESNWRCAAGEVDLVMHQDDEIVFVEVKVRHGAAYGSAEESISHSKAKKLLATGEWYVAEHFPHEQPIWRIDLFAITLDFSGKLIRRTHIRNAVESD